jgi:hypothetical protein
VFYSGVSEEEEELGLDISMHNESTVSSMRMDILPPPPSGKQYEQIGMTSSQTSEYDDLSASVRASQPRTTITIAPPAAIEFRAPSPNPIPSDAHAPTDPIPIPSPSVVDYPQQQHVQQQPHMPPVPAGMQEV